MDTEENIMNHGAGRRSFLKSAAIAGAAVLPSAAVSSEGKGMPSKQSSNPSKGREYLDMFAGMVRDLLKESSENIEIASAICAETILSGKKVYYTVRGHNEPLCILEKRAGKPSFLIPTEQNIDYSIFQKDDALITERSNFCAGAKEKGVRLIGILMPFQPQKTQGQGIVHEGYPGPWMEEICEVCIWDRVPYTVGTMPFEQLPFKAVPAHGAMDGIILNLILAGTIDKLLEKGYTVSAEM
jgi:uncharacterized phosphosugar-binding protein